MADRVHIILCPLNPNSFVLQKYYIDIGIHENDLKKCELVPKIKEKQLDLITLKKRNGFSSMMWFLICQEAEQIIINVDFLLLFWFGFYFMNRKVVSTLIFSDMKWISNIAEAFYVELSITIEDIRMSKLYIFLFHILIIGSTWKILNRWKIYTWFEFS